MADDWERLQAVLVRAQRAIQRAKNLTEQLADVPDSRGDAEDAQPSPSQTPLQPDADTHAACSFGQAGSPADLAAGATPASQQEDTSPSPRSRWRALRGPLAPTQHAATSDSPSSGLASAPASSSWPDTQHHTLLSAAEQPANAAGDLQYGVSEHPQPPTPPSHPPSQDTQNAHPVTDTQDETWSSPSQHLSPLLTVARRLSLLQHQQSSTLSQLLGLRLEQLTLRQQQLLALQELLRAESASVEGTALQVSAVDQAVALLSQSLLDMDDAARAITGHTGPLSSADVQLIAATVSAADQRAEDISRMARQLLSVLREYPRRTGMTTHSTQDITAQGSTEEGEAAGTRTRILIRGATEWELLQLSTQSCHPAHPQLGEACPICLAQYTEEEALTVMPCSHWHHTACLRPWLRIKACCPTCRTALPGTQVVLRTPRSAGLDALQAVALSSASAAGGEDSAVEEGVVGPQLAVVEGGDVGTEQEQEPNEA